MDPDLSDTNLDKVQDEHDAAANVVRGKLTKIYSDEPNAKEEIDEVSELKTEHVKLSKYQKYMDELTKSGRSLAEIQTAWHDYYQSLSDSDKHEVWQEFYEEHEQKRAKKSQKKEEAIKPAPMKPTEPIHANHVPARKRSSTKDELIQKVAERAKKSQKNPHAHSLLFGLGMGSLVVFILLFSFFNERFITPFIRPNQNVSATSIIVDPNQSGRVGPESKIIIPKINVEVPVVYDEPSIEDKAIQKALEKGVVHYPITPNPGEKGNSVIFGHSSSNILNNGKYKFAFLLLKSLEDGDTFIVQKDGKRYVYKVFKKFVTEPKDLSVLDPSTKPIVTLITCDPPGSSANRLIIQGEQIFPNPSKNVASSVDPTVQNKPEALASNAPSLWSRLTNWFN